MITAEIKSEYGGTCLLEIKGDIYHMYKAMSKQDIPDSPKKVKLEKGKVKLSADDELGNHLIRLFRKTDTLEDVRSVSELLHGLRDDIRSQVESRILDDRYVTKEDLFRDVRDLKISFASDKLSFYCPLVGYVIDHEDGEEYEPQNHLLLAHEDEINELLRQAQQPELDMGKYLGDQAQLPNRILLAEWYIEDVCGTMYGRIDCYLNRKLNTEEVERLRQAGIGQNSDGLGETLEQRPIPVEDGELYVSFWNSSEDYFLFTEEEFDDYIQIHSEIGML